MFKFSCFMIAAIMLTACQINKGSLDNLLVKGSETFRMSSTYESINHDFKRGRIMRARARILALDKSNRDYGKAHRLLEQKIEPARRRLFVHYLRIAKDLEKKKLWSKAIWAYDQAGSVSIKPEAMKKKQAEMQKKIRQLRLEKLLEQRRKEDRTLFSYAPAYEPPKGISPKDEIYERMREHYNDSLDARANLAFREALRFLHKDLPEIAYIEIESFLRLQPDSNKGVALLASIKRKMPAFLTIPTMPAANAIEKPAIIKRANHTKSATAKQVQAALKSGELLKARQLAHIYRRNGGKDADKLLNQVQKKVDASAATMFSKGSIAFRNEQLDRAIQYWDKAVMLKPDESEYVEALRRARQLQERLNLLQESK